MKRAARLAVEENYSASSHLPLWREEDKKIFTAAQFLRLLPLIGCLDYLLLSRNC
jgi:hypothetical protein